MQRLLIIILLSLLLPGFLSGQESLSFRPDGTFTLLQFTDAHLDGGHRAGADSTFRTMRTLIEKVRPDLAVLTGDIVTEKEDAREMLLALCRLFGETRTPFVLTLGNHDPEALPKSEIFDLLESSPFYAGSRGPESLAPAMGDCRLLIRDRTGRAAALLYFLDSGSGDPIRFDQIARYREISSLLKKEHGTLPALMFFHIPIPEFDRIDGGVLTFGQKGEPHGDPRAVNSGLFASLLDMQEVMGVFCGHNHDNDLIGMDSGIALAYGRVTGQDAYGSLPRGGRVIRLYEGERRFDTWIQTSEGSGPIYYYPSGITSLEESESAYLPPLTSAPTENGVTYAYLEGSFRSVSDISGGTLVREGTLPYFSIDGADCEDHFAFKFRSFVRIPERGIYRFYTRSDDGSILRIDGETVADNDGGHSPRKAEGKIALEAGFHLLEVLYFEDYMGQELSVGFSSKTIPEQPLPPSLLFY